MKGVLRLFLPNVWGCQFLGARQSRGKYCERTGPRGPSGRSDNKLPWRRTAGQDNSPMCDMQVQRMVRTGFSRRQRWRQQFHRMIDPPIAPSARCHGNNLINKTISPYRSRTRQKPSASAFPVHDRETRCVRSVTVRNSLS